MTDEYGSDGSVQLTPSLKGRRRAYDQNKHIWN